ncbi:hypothetical protein CJP74_03320 [Psittacicella melopsittaci]|uniref:Carbon storage regulator n=1 Tax=Psittacicella melopsittaci TaxID=2028576 RepID=A0A3A1YA51_9GAMM|nr:carbon storage regulator [Psittacicella melopsittaci]RIY33024.1 hypothetical protein CJP74_03320 [Psittacicella melopsittaci]
MAKLLIKRKVGQRIRINADIEIIVAKTSSKSVNIVVCSPNNNLVTIVDDKTIEKEKEPGK